MVIVIDPGHGGPDPGTTSGGILEKEYNLKVALLLRDALLAQWNDLTVVMTRESDTEVNPDARSLGEELQARCDIANAYPDSVFISIHHDSTGDPSASGAGMFVYGPVSYLPAVAADGTVNHQAPRSYALAEAMMPTFVQTLGAYGIGSRGIRTGDFQVLRNTNARGVLIESFFASNPSDVATAMRPDFPGALANGYAQMLGEALELTPKRRRPIPVRIVLPGGRELMGEFRADGRTWFQIPGSDVWAPIRAVGESMGRKVTWYDDGPRVVVQ